MTVVLATLFVSLAGFNVWSMLTGRAVPARARWLRAHRAAGYLFIALYLILCFFMLRRATGSEEPWPASIVLHMALAFSLAPLLLVKVIVARHQKAARSLLTALGIWIFASAFTLVAITLAIRALRIGSRHPMPAWVPAAFVATVLLAAAAAGVRVGGRRRSAPDGAPFAAPPAVGTNATDAVTLTLARIEAQGPDARTLRFLVPPDRPLAARPGQFLTFEWPIDGETVTRSYSICSSPTQAGYVEITAKRVPNGRVSGFLNDRASVGLTVRARGPYGAFQFDERKHGRAVFVAGGSGITPMIAMLRYLDDRCIAARVTLIYCVRTEEEVLFRQDLVALRERLRQFRYVLVLSRPGTGWIGWSGHLRREILDEEVERPRASTFFLCGPPAFMEQARALLREMAVEPSRILQESFGGGVARGAGSAAPPGALTVRLSRSGTVCAVSPDETLLDGLERNGVLIPSGCRQGQCGTCATRLLAGHVRMDGAAGLSRDQREQGFVLPCVSRPLDEVTLDA